MRDYELMVIYDPNLDDAAVEAANNRVTSAITQREGVVQSVEAWGRRRLAYPIGRFRDGVYVLLRFDVEPRAITEIERGLRLMEQVVRFLVVRAIATPPAPQPSAPRPAPQQTAAA